MWLLEHFCINPLVLILTSNFGICRFWINLMPYRTQHPHPLQMDYIYYKSNEQYLHYFIMKYSHNNFNEKCNIIFLYNYIAHFHERTPWCINRFVYVSIANFWVAKCNIGIMTLNPHYLWEAKMLNPYIKHGTFLVEFDDHIKTIQGYWFL
jgi:hypothetical protein